MRADRRSITPGELPERLGQGQTDWEAYNAMLTPDEDWYIVLEDEAPPENVEITDKTLYRLLHDPAISAKDRGERRPAAFDQKGSIRLSRVSAEGPVLIEARGVQWIPVIRDN